MRKAFGFVGKLLAITLLASTTAVGSDEGIGLSSSALWRAGDGDWAVSLNWRNGMVPGLGANAPSVFLDPQVPLEPYIVNKGSNAPGDAVSSNVTLSLTVNISGLYLGSTDSLRILHGGMMTLTSSVNPGVLIFNGGQIDIEQMSLPTGIMVGGGRSLSLVGDGRITLNHPTLASITGATGSESFTIYGGVIDGSGLFGEGALSITNFGVIESNQQFRRLTVEASPAGMTNAGTIRATNFSRLLVRNSIINNAGGTFEASQSSVVDLDNSTIRGGLIVTDADSAVRNLDAPAALCDVSIAGNVEVGAAQLTLSGTITNDGTIFCIGDSAARGGALPVNPSQIVIPNDGGTVLNGSGRLELVVGSVWSGQAGVHAQFTNGANHTIAGRGNIGNDTLCIINDGTIVADGATALVLDPCDSSAFTNNGTIKAIGDGVVYLVDGVFQNYGTIEVAEGGQIVMLPGAMLNNSLTGSLFGGKWIIRGSNDPSELMLLTVSDFSINMADVTLDGVLSRFDRLNTLQYNFGAFHLLNGRTFAATADFTNGAMLHVDAHSKLTSTAKITLNSGSHVILEVSNDSNGKLQATTRATLGGVLELVLAPGASWTPGREIQLITGNQITGQFAKVIAPGAFDLTVVAGGVVLVPANNCPGDVNLDGAVNVIDLLLMLDGWGVCPGTGACAGDVNDSGAVDIFDLLQAISVFGSCP